MKICHRDDTNAKIGLQNVSSSYTDNCTLRVEKHQRIFGTRRYSASSPGKDTLYKVQPTGLAFNNITSNVTELCILWDWVLSTPSAEKNDRCARLRKTTTREYSIIIWTINRQIFNFHFEIWILNTNLNEHYFRTNDLQLCLWYCNLTLNAEHFMKFLPPSWKREHCRGTPHGYWYVMALWRYNSHKITLREREKNEYPQIHWKIQIL